MVGSYPSALNATCECTKLSQALPESSVLLPHLKTVEKENEHFCDCLVPLHDQFIYSFIVHRKHHDEVRRNLLKAGVNFTDHVSFVPKRNGLNKKVLKDKGSTRVVSIFLFFFILSYILNSNKYK